MNKKEIEEYIKSKSVTQDNYVAPTVKTNVVNTAPAMTAVAQKPISNSQYFGLAAKTGLTSGITSVPQAGLQEIERSLKKGEQIKTPLDVTSQLSNTITNATIKPNLLGAIGNYISDAKKIWSDKDKNVLSKILGTGVSAANNAIKMTGLDMSKYSDLVFPFVGAANKGLDEKVEQLRNNINQPAKNLQQQFAEQSEGRGTLPRIIGEGIQAVSNMAPSVAASYLTGNPDISMVTMLNNAKGQATQEALDKGASLDEAIKIGNAKALTEYATEKMTGGLNVFGKGDLDDVIDNAANKYIKNEILNFAAKQGIGIGGEILEEIASDVIGTLIDKGTLDPNAKYTKEDLLNTVGPTAISTAILNAITGGYSPNAYRQNIANMNQNNNQNNGVSNELKNEIENKTVENQKNRKDVEFMPIEQVLPLIKEGGYRTSEQYSKLVDNIKSNGIETPIEIVKNSDGSVELYNGNHRLKAAAEIGLKEVPIKYVSNDIEASNDIEYNNEISDYYNGGNNVNKNTNAISRLNERNEFAKRNSVEDRNTSKNKRTTAEHDKLSSTLQRNNDESSSTSTSKQSTTKKGLKNSSFSNENKTEVKSKQLIKVKPTVKLKEVNGKYTRQDVIKTAEQMRKRFNNETLTNKKGKKVSNFYSNLTEKSQFITPENRESLKSEESIKFYKPITNKQSLNEAIDRIGTTPASQSKALHEFLKNDKQFTATDTAEGWILLKQYQDAGNYDAMVNVARKMGENLRESARALQAASIEQRLTPEGMYMYAVSELAQAEQKYNSEKGRKKSDIEKNRERFRLTPEETEFIRKQMEKVKNMEDGRARDIEVAKINTMLQNKLPHEKGQSLKAWMRISMLFNPKTQVRNVAGNLGIIPVNALSDVFASAVDKAVSKKTGARTIGAPSLSGAKSYVKGAKKNIGEAIEDYKLGINTKDVRQDRFDVGQGKAFDENHTGPLKEVRNAISKFGNKTNDILNLVMDAGDRGFYGGSLENSLYNLQKLNNTNEITQEMYDIAEMEGLQRTWNDDNQFTKAVLNIRRAINDIGDTMYLKIGKYGLGDLMIPFAKTPANLTKAIVDYSPVGFLNAITEGKNLKRAIETGNYTMQQQHDFAQAVGKAAAGSMLYILGVALAKAKITSGSGDEDKDLKNFMRYNLGIQPYSIKIGNKSFTYDWAQPMAAPLAITADIEKGVSENMTPAQALQQFLTTGFNVLTEQSFLSGVNEVLNDNDGILHGIEQQIINMPATAIPTLLKQYTDMVDSTKRQTYSKEGMVENAKKYSQSKIPTESKKLAPQVDVLGNEIKKYGGDNSIFNVFFNPANMEKGKSSDVSKEIYALYQATGNKNIIPRKVDYSITIDGKKKTLTTKEMEKWQKASGKLVTENVEQAMKNEKYQKMSDEDKASVINGIVNYSYMKAKSETFGIALSSYYNGPSNAEKKGIPMYDYYISKIK